MRTRRRVWVALEGSGRGSRISFAIKAVIIGAILLNAAAMILETVPTLEARHHQLFGAIELITFLLFTIEYAARVWTAPEKPERRYRAPVKGRLRYVLSPLAVIDFVAIAPFLLRMLGLVDLSLLRLIRLVAMLKLTRNSPPLQAIGAALYNERKLALAALSIIGVTLIFVSTIMWMLERDAQPEKFASIPDAMWWGIVTLTTIGFGDVVPVTTLGKVFGGLVAVMGIATFALPAAILAASFSRELSRRDFAVTVPMLARMKALSEFAPPELRRLCQLAEPRIVATRHAIARRDEPADGLYLLLEGGVEIEQADGVLRLGPGEAFGIDTHHAPHGRHADSVIATEPTRLIYLSLDALKDVRG